MRPRRRKQNSLHRIQGGAEDFADIASAEDFRAPFFQLMAFVVVGQELRAGFDDLVGGSGGDRIDQIGLDLRIGESV